MSIIGFDKPLFDDLTLAYAKAVADNLDVFTWHGRELVVSYAKYMLEYLGERFK